MSQLNLPTRLNAFPRMLAAMLLVLSALALSGCFHNDDDPAPPPPPIVNADPTGYYTNSGFVQVMMVDNTTPRTTAADFQGMVTGSQFMMLSDADNLAYIGTFTVSGNALSGSVTVYDAGVMLEKDVPLNGVITEGTTLTGTLGGSGAANGTFQLNYAPAADNGPVDLGMVVRTMDWRPVDNLNIPSLDLENANDATSVFNFKAGGTGSNVFSGCSYLGRMEPIAGTHLYTVSVTMDNCSPGTIDVEAIPAYTGLASVRGLNPDRFILALSNGAYDFSGEYRECLIIGCPP